MVKILVVGQTPPPYGGQAIMIEKLLNASFRNIKIYHIRLSFSKEFNESGKANINKLFHLLSVIIKIIFARFRYKVNILYYPPAGKNRIPMLRDIIILLFTRPFFTKTIFHFHGNGVSELYNTLPRTLQFFFRKAYWHPDISIRLSSLNPEDGKMFNTKKEFIIPNGIEDFSLGYKKNGSDRADINLLYVGLIRESKGILILLESFYEVHKINKNVKLNVVGQFESKLIKEKVFAFIADHRLPVIYHGELLGKPKYMTYSMSDIFCFPSFFESEGLPLVLLEAMQFELPIVSTIWRGIPDVVKDGENGFLVPIKNSHMLVEKLDLLIRNKELRKEMGKKGRKLFLERYSLEKHLSEMEKVFNTV